MQMGTEQLGKMILDGSLVKVPVEGIEQINVSYYSNEIIFTTRSAGENQISPLFHGLVEVPQEEN